MMIMLAACGTEITPRGAQLDSGSGPLTPSQPTTTGSDGMAQCSTFDSASTRLIGKTTTYYYNGALQEDKVRVRFTSLLAEFDTSSNMYIQFFRWKTVVNASGQRVSSLDSTPLQFNFELGTGSTSPISDNMASISAGAIARIRADKSVSGSGSLDFFSKTTLVLTGVTYDWQAVKAVVYDGSTTPAKVVGQVDFLVPVFQANPNRYAISHDSILAATHPFWSQRTQSLSEADWASRAASNCF